MPFREQEAEDRCVICQKSGDACRNCQAIHCEQHLVDGSCAACQSTLLNLEHGRVQRTGLVASIAAIPLSGASIALALSSAAIAPLGLAALGVIATSAFVLKKRLRPMIRRSIANTSLPPRSQRLLPPGPTENSADGSNTLEARQRPRGLQKKPQSRRAHFKFWNH